MSSLGERAGPERGGTFVSATPLRQILLVEDDEDTRQLLTLALGAQGYGVVQAEDAERGLEALRGGDRFDMVLSDYDLPGKTGAAMLREAQRGGLLGGAATLIVTAHPDPEGVDEVTLIRKPLDLAKFLLQIRRIFDSLPAHESVAAAGPDAPATDRRDQPEGIELRLYIGPESPASLKARRTMEKLFEDFRAAHITFDVVDLAVEPERAEEDHVVFTPTLVKLGPEPRAWIVGDLSDPAVVADLIHMCGIEPIS